MNPSAKPNAFKDQERAGWNKKAADYDSHAGTVTRQAIEPLLDAVGAERGSELLDIASGPGYGAGAAAARGAQATGIDLSAAMVEEARRRFPDARFREGDAEALPFDDARFDAAICGFGLLHMPAPERAIAEAHRILRPGGRFGFTVWCPPAKAKFFEIVLAAIEAHVDTEVGLPPAPPMFHYGEPATALAALRNDGFVAAEVVELPLVFRAAAPSDVVEFVKKSAVRLSMLLDLQTEAVRQRTYDAIVAGAGAYVRDDAVAIPMPALLASARRPAD